MKNRGGSARRRAQQRASAAQRRSTASGQDSQQRRQASPNIALFVRRAAAPRAARHRSTSARRRRPALQQWPARSRKVVRNEGSSIDHQVTIYLHAQNITMFPTNETWYFASQILVSNSGGLILILTAQSTRNMFRIHSPQPEAGFLRQPALEGLTRSARMDSPRRIGRNEFRRSGGGGGVHRAAAASLMRGGEAAARSLETRESRIQYLCDPQWFRDTASRGPTTIVAPGSQFRTLPIGSIVQYGPFNPYIPIRSTTIGKSRVAIDPIAMHTSWRSNSDIASVTSYLELLDMYQVNFCFAFCCYDELIEFSLSLPLIARTKSLKKSDAALVYEADVANFGEVCQQQAPVAKVNAVVALVMVAAGSRRAIVRVIEEVTRVWFEEPVADEKRRRLIKWKRCVLSIASGTSSEGSVALFNPVARFEVLDSFCRG
ncbi:hypothetical protein F511_13775 [Dorcoceras hygrometricum]|uniref:Uncharacterized protein n=1 Tax=Dorcoceras hygrometricum TaxID=472368 RepID=A0A2Z7CZI1_9LAMI|nr:hypothetical protein F511_13775 [Dorcoceras hygrometricum]